MMEAIGISAWAGFQDAKERAIELTEAGGFPLSFFFEEEQAWEVIDTADENQYLRLSELQPYARCPPQFK